MIVDGVNVMDLALGADRRIVEDGDAQLVIPSTIIPVLLNARPHSPAPTLATTVFQGSVLARDAETINGPAQGDTAFNLMLLDRGLWELEYSMASLFDFTTTPAGPSRNRLRITYQGITLDLLARYAQIGSFNDFGRSRLLLSSSAQISQVVGFTGAGQNDLVHCSVNAIRIL